MKKPADPGMPITMRSFPVTAVAMMALTQVMQVVRWFHTRDQFKEQKLCGTSSSAGENCGQPLCRMPTP
jgi:hypothetical protein